MVSVSVRLVALWMLLLLSEANLEVQAAQVPFISLSLLRWITFIHSHYYDAI